MDNLVQSYNNTLSKEFCDHVIDLFKNSNDQAENTSSLMIHANLDNPDWLYVYDYVRENLLSYMVDYLSKFPFIYINSKYSNQSSLIRTAQLAFMSGNNGIPHMRIQRYVEGQGDRIWHHENHGGNTSKRELVFTYYLNDVNGGETEMLYTPGKITPETGKLAMFPAYWTHKHKVNPPQEGQTKYIITGWIENMGTEVIKKEFNQDYSI
jgi:Rps23 Pro-64 3,4-dihydroxylase Tpa1-like proline 4-hydroxylase